MESMSRSQQVFLGIFAVVLIVVIAFFARFVISTNHSATGIVIDKHGTPSQSAISVGSVNGNPAVVNTTSGGENDLIVKVSDGSIHIMSVSMNQYYSTNIGDTLNLVCNQFACAIR